MASKGLNQRVQKITYCIKRVKLYQQALVKVIGSHYINSALINAIYIVLS